MPWISTIYDGIGIEFDNDAEMQMLVCSPDYYNKKSAEALVKAFFPAANDAEVADIIFRLSITGRKKEEYETVKAFYYECRDKEETARKIAEMTQKPRKPKAPKPPKLKRWANLVPYFEAISKAVQDGEKQTGVLDEQFKLALQNGDFSRTFSTFRGYYFEYKREVKKELAAIDARIEKLKQKID